MLIMLIIALVAAAAGWWFRESWVTAAKELAQDTLAPILMPRRVLNPQRLMEAIVKSSTRKIPTVAGGHLALAKLFTIHLSPRDLATANFDIEAMRIEVALGLVKFAETHGNLTSEWFPEIDFISSAEVTDGWPVAKASYNQIDKVRAHNPSAAKPSADDRLRQRMTDHYGYYEPSRSHAASKPVVDGFAPTAHLSTDEDEGDTIYSEHNTRYMDDGDLGSRHKNVLSTLVPLDPSDPKVELLKKVTAIGRSTVGGCAEVSREHCTIDAVTGGWVLIDKGSTNGTLVNGVPVHGSKALCDGDKIRFGAKGPIYLFNQSDPQEGTGSKVAA